MRYLILFFTCCFLTEICTPCDNRVCEFFTLFVSGVVDVCEKSGVGRSGGDICGNPRKKVGWAQSLYADRFDPKKARPKFLKSCIRGCRKKYHSKFSDNMNNFLTRFLAENKTSSIICDLFVLWSVLYNFPKLRCQIKEKRDSKYVYDFISHFPCLELSDYEYDLESCASHLKEVSSEALRGFLSVFTNIIISTFFKIHKRQYSRECWNRVLSKRLGKMINQICNLTRFLPSIKAFHSKCCPIQ